MLFFQLKSLICFFAPTKIKFLKCLLGYRTPSGYFNEHTKLAVMALMITCSLLLYSDPMMLMNVKSDVRGYKKIAFQG